MNIRRIIISLLVDPLRIIVAALENWSCPLRQQLLCHFLDATLGALALGVENNHFSNATGNQSILVDRKFGNGGQQVALDVVGGHRAIVQRLEEESNGF